jgi:hypothetical protein
MTETSTNEPLWAQRMRARGYDLRVGSGEHMSEIPDAAFYPPPSTRLSRTGTPFRALLHAVRTASDAVRRAITHAPLP